MELTVKQVMEELHKLDCKVISGAGGLQNEILVVDGMEVPDIAPWLMEGELLTTTGYSLRDRKDGLLHLVQDMHKAGGAAIILKTRFLGEVPKNVMEESNRLKIPIIETPNRLKYAELKKIVYRLMMEASTPNYDSSEKIQNEFMKVMLSEGDFQESCDKIYDILHLPTLILDGSGILLAKSPQKGSAIPFEVNDFLSNPEYIEFKSSNAVFQNIKYNNELWSVFKIYVHHMVVGCVAVCCGAMGLTKNVRAVMHHAIDTITLQYIKMQAVKKSSSVFDDNLFVDIIMENIKSPQALNYRAQSLNWPAPPFCMVLFNIDNFQEHIKNKTEVEIQHIKNCILQFISNFTLYHHLKNVVISKGDLFVLLLKKNDRTELEHLIESIIDFIKDNLEIDVTVGCVLQIEDYISIKSKYKEAQNVITICRKKFKNKKLMFSDDVLLEQGLLHSMNEYFIQYTQRTIGVLEQYDKEHHSDLLKVLTVLIKNKGVRKKTAEELFIHRNTLTEKLAKIEAILHVDLEKSDDFYNLFLAIFVKELL